MQLQMKIYSVVRGCSLYEHPSRDSVVGVVSIM